MSAHTLVNLLNELGKAIKCYPRILSLFPNKFNKFNNTEAWMQVWRENVKILSYYATLLCASFHNIIKMCKSLVVYGC